MFREPRPVAKTVPESDLVQGVDASLVGVDPGPNGRLVTEGGELDGLATPVGVGVAEACPADADGVTADAEPDLLEVLLEFEDARGIHLLRDIARDGTHAGDHRTRVSADDPVNRGHHLSPREHGVGEPLPERVAAPCGDAQIDRLAIAEQLQPCGDGDPAREGGGEMSYLPDHFDPSIYPRIVLCPRDIRG